jgi:(p)ppGpp synthase/HD superfamily hydrolase
MPLTARFSQALVYAVELHAAQLRKVSGVPYVAHLLGVAAIALEHGAGEDEAIAALLHDAVEDQGGAPVRDDIRRRFGNHVADVVDGCTDADTTPKPPWRPRKERYLARLAQAGSSVRLVCSADKLHNLRSLLQDYRLHGESLWEQFSGGRAGTLWYYRSVATTLAGVERTALVEELERAVDELERLAAASQK